MPAWALDATACVHIIFWLFGDFIMSTFKASYRCSKGMLPGIPGKVEDQRSGTSPGPAVLPAPLAERISCRPETWLRVGGKAVLALTPWLGAFWIDYVLDSYNSFRPTSLVSATWMEEKTLIFFSKKDERVLVKIFSASAAKDQEIFLRNRLCEE